MRDGFSRLATRVFDAAALSSRGWVFPPAPSRSRPWHPPRRSDWRRRPEKSVRYIVVDDLSLFSFLCLSFPSLSPPPFSLPLPPSSLSLSLSSSSCSSTRYSPREQPAAPRPSRRTSSAAPSRRRSGSRRLLWTCPVRAAKGRSSSASRGPSRPSCPGPRSAA